MTEEERKMLIHALATNRDLKKRVQVLENAPESESFNGVETTLIGSNTLEVASASLAVEIPATPEYDEYKIRLKLGNDRAANFDYGIIQFNEVVDATKYLGLLQVMLDTSLTLMEDSGDIGGIRIGHVPSVNADSNFGYGEVTIVNPFNSDTYVHVYSKISHVHSTTKQYATEGRGFYTKASAGETITEVTFKNENGDSDFIIGSSIELYGLNYPTS